MLLKGGHLPGEQVVDLLATADGIEEFVAPRIESRHTHGTGCTLASAVAAGLAQGLGLRDAVVARAGVCAGGDRGRAGLRRRTWAAEPRGRRGSRRVI